MLLCPKCGSEKGFGKAGSILSARGRVQRFICLSCNKKFHPSLKSQPIILREGYLDIEALGLKANFDPMLCWSIKPRGEDKIVSCLIGQWSLAAERKVVHSLCKAMREFDRLITYNGTMYDLPFIRTRALRHGLEFPEYMAMYHLDLYFVCRSRLSAHRKNLGTIAKVLGVEEKLELDPRDWELANFGNKAALKRILEHNQQDVVVLEAVHDKIEPFFAGINRSI